MPTQARRRLARLAHVGRLALIVTIVWQLTARASERVPDQIRIWDAAANDLIGGDLGWSTWPDGDEVMGWAGPTTMVFLPTGEGRVEYAVIARSADSASYLERIEDDPQFLSSLRGLSMDELASWRVDTVSGATLTSRAIQGAVRRQFGGWPDTEPLPLLVFEPSEGAVEEYVGATVSKAGYQGPTHVVYEVDAEDRILRVVLGDSFDNEPYVGDVREDYSFLKSFQGLTIAEAAELGIGRGGVEGVSGATMTSQGIARSIKESARRVLWSRGELERSELEIARTTRELIGWMVGGAAFLVLLTPLRRRRGVRNLLRVGAVLGFGAGAGALLSLDALRSWSQFGLPWQSAPLLAGFVIAAIAGPALFGRKTYCRSLCAHGALQQLLAPRARGKVAPRVDALFRRIPGVLLCLAVVVLVSAPDRPVGGPELAAWEPFAAWTPQSAAMASLILAGLSVLAAAWVPLAYCHYACPTGALLEYLRFQPKTLVKVGDIAALGLMVATLSI